MDTTEMEKFRILTMWECGKSTSEIAKSINKSTRTVQRWLAHQKKEGNMARKPRGLRPRKTTPEEDAKIIQLVQENPDLTQKEILTICNLNIYKGTLRRRLQEAKGIYNIDLFPKPKARPRKYLQKSRKMKHFIMQSATPNIKEQQTEANLLLESFLPKEIENSRCTESQTSFIDTVHFEEIPYDKDDNELSSETSDDNNDCDDETDDDDEDEATEIIKIEITEESSPENKSPPAPARDPLALTSPKTELSPVLEPKITEVTKKSIRPRKIFEITEKDEKVLKIARKKRLKPKNIKTERITAESDDDFTELKTKKQRKHKIKLKFNVGEADDEDLNVDVEEPMPQIKVKVKGTKERRRRRREEKLNWEKDGKDTTELEKTKILIMAECGMSTSEIAKSLKKSRRTVQRWLSKHKKGLEMDRKERGRRPRKTTPEEDARIIQLVQENPDLSRREILKLGNINLHKVTLKNRLNEAGLYFNSQGEKILDFTEEQQQQMKLMQMQQEELEQGMENIELDAQDKKDIPLLQIQTVHEHSSVLQSPQTPALHVHEIQAEIENTSSNLNMDIQNTTSAASYLGVGNWYC